MKQKQIFIILGAIGLVLLLLWFAVLALVVTNVSRLLNKGEAPAVTEVTLCDENASDLCIVTFGANNLNRMVIDFQLPTADYAPFYVKATNRETVSVYTCEVIESKPESVSEAVAVTATATESGLEQPTAEVESAPTHAQCTGIRTPLGETIDLEVYTTDGDRLIARGTFLVSSIARSTPISLPTETPIQEESSTSTPDSEENFLPGQDEPTPTPDFGYPNP
jgi:hypothetical protein